MAQPEPTLAQVGTTAAQREAEFLIGGEAEATTAEIAAITHGEGGMPQLQFETFSSQIFWMIVTFAFLYLLLSRSLLPRIHTVMEGRQNKISHDIDRAEHLRNEAEEARETYERALKESRMKAQELIAESSALMEKSAAARNTELDGKLEKQLNDAEANIASAKSEALAKLAPVSKELTQHIVEKLTGQKLQSSEVSSVVDTLIKEKANV